jgi:hypothetical protein
MPAPVFQPDLDGGSGDFGPPDAPPSGGGVPGTGTGSSSGGSFPTGENGGVFANNYFLFIPVQDVNTKQCYIGFYDINNFDDTKDSSSYTYRKENVVTNATPTVNRVDLTYKDMGLAKITVTINAVNDNQQIISSSITVQIGNAIPTGELFTIFVPITLTGMRPQLSWTRVTGPVCITRAVMRGEVEEDSQ